MNNLGLLLNEWRTALNNESTVTGNTRLLLSAAFFYNSDYFTLLYPIQAIRNSLDWINVMAYDFYDPRSYAWRLVNADDNGFFAPTSGAAITSGGALGYDQIRAFIAQNNAVQVYNTTVVSNYCYVGTTWIGYDDTQSIEAKVSYAKQNALLGYFAWHVGADDNSVLSQTGQWK
ncbi:hypothetical protein V6N13_113341 [Hibiscus sabdariffa]|uniref:GH18 domain-containing protein n=1 Tax=Hibiscus sabdariffa TaxID=183260 RepID=A0ABR2CUD5_9ROSI